MCEDFWINQTLQDAGSVPEFREEYFAKFVFTNFKLIFNNNNLDVIVV